MEERQEPGRNTREGVEPDWLFPVVYDELCSIARSHLRKSGREEVLQTTALVHDVYLRLRGQGRIAANDRVHYLALAARTLRRVLVEHLRARHAAKRSAPAGRIGLSSELVVGDGPSIELVALDEALARLEASHGRRAQVVELRFFGGLSVEETAEVLNVSPRTVKDDWAIARAFLHRELAVKHDG